ncbi:Hypothetical protein A7982_02242 [Minicystis rosea]|nr:Hypothetical protein A7982_02242 [Minicystis rosea]
MNGLIQKITTLEARIEALETGAVVSAQSPVITAILSKGVDVSTIPLLHTGEPLEIYGQNFGITRGAQSVSFNGFAVTAFKSGTNDGLLLIDIPSINVPDGGVGVLLKVGNGYASITRTLTIAPPSLPIPSNVIDIFSDPPSPNPIVPLSSVLFAYRIKSRAARTATFTLAPHVISAGWPSDTALDVLDESNQPLPLKQISVAPLQERKFSVRVPTVPSGAGSSVDVQVTATFESTVVVKTASIPVGTPVVQLSFSGTPQSADFINLANSNTDPSGGTFNKNDPTLTVKVKSGYVGKVYIDTLFNEKDTYSFKTQTVTGTNWTTVVDGAFAGPVGPDRFTDPGTKAHYTTVVNIIPKAGASAAGSFDFRIERQNSTQVITIRFLLALG